MPTPNRTPDLDIFAPDAPARQLAARSVSAPAHAQVALTFYEQCAFDHGASDARHGVTDGGAAYYQRHGDPEPVGQSAYLRGFASVAQ